MATSASLPPRLPGVGAAAVAAESPRGGRSQAYHTASGSAVGGGRDEWKPLRGKYRNLIEPRKHHIVEKWYNTMAAPNDRRLLRDLVNDICDATNAGRSTANGSADTKKLRAPGGANQLSLTGFQLYVHTWFAEKYRPDVLRWVNICNNEELRCFVHVVTELERCAALAEFRERTLPETKFPFGTPRYQPTMSKKKPSRHNLDGREPFARLPIFYDRQSVTKDTFQPISPEKMDKFKCRADDNILNRLACNPRFTSVMRIIPGYPIEGAKERPFEHEGDEVAKELIHNQRDIDAAHAVVQRTAENVRHLQSKLGSTTRTEGPGPRPPRMKAMPAPFTTKFMS